MENNKMKTEKRKEQLINTLYNMARDAKRKQRNVKKLHRKANDAWVINDESYKHFVQLIESDLKVMSEHLVEAKKCIEEALAI